MKTRKISLLGLLILIELVSRAWAIQTDTLYMHRASRDRRPQPSEIALVHKALAGFVAGVQHGMPGIAEQYFNPEILSGTIPGKQPSNQFYDAIRSMRRVGDNPIVQIVMPHISIGSGKASVECHILWHFQNGKGEIIKIKDREHLVLVKRSGEYRIMGSARDRFERYLGWSSRRSGSPQRYRELTGRIACRRDDGRRLLSPGQGLYLSMDAVRPRL